MDQQQTLPLEETREEKAKRQHEHQIRFWHAVEYGMKSKLNLSPKNREAYEQGCESMALKLPYKSSKSDIKVKAQEKLKKWGNGENSEPLLDSEIDAVCEDPDDDFPF